MPPPTQAELDALTKGRLLELLGEEATREDLLGLWLGIQWAKGRLRNEDGTIAEHHVVPHPPEVIEATDGVQLATDATPSPAARGAWVAPGGGG